MKELNIFCFILNLIITVIIGVFLTIIPALTRKTFLFGVRVPETAQSHKEALRMKKNYITISIIGTIFVFLLNIVQYISKPSITILASMYFPLLLICVQVFAYIPNWKKALELKERNNWKVSSTVFAETASSHSRGSLWSIPWVYYIISFAIIIISIIITLIKYPSLPNPLPTHFDINGNPDGWMTKSVLVALLVPLMNVLMLVIMILSAVAVVKTKLQINTQNPSLSFAQHRLYRRKMGHGMGILTIFLVIGMMIPGLPVIYEGFKVSIWITMSIIILPSILLTVIQIRSGQGGCKLKPVITQADTLATGYDIEHIKNATSKRGDDRYWALGMFYHNPEDPAILVEDRFGTNIGFNYSHIGVKIGVALSLLLIVASYVWITVYVYSQLIL